MTSHPALPRSTTVLAWLTILLPLPALQVFFGPTESSVLLVAVCLLASTLAFLAWFWVSYDNVHRLGRARELIIQGRLWALLGWLIPGVNLLLPLPLMLGLWRASLPKARLGTIWERGGPALIVVLWLLSLATNIVAITAKPETRTTLHSGWGPAVGSGGETFSMHHTWETVEQVPGLPGGPALLGLFVVATLLSWVYVLSVTGMQRGAEPRPRPPSTPGKSPPTPGPVMGLIGCVRCQEGVPAAERVDCAGCGAPHHTRCWAVEAESGCARCRHGLTRQAARSASVRRVGLFVVGVTTVGAAAVWRFSLERPDVRPRTRELPPPVVEPAGYLTPSRAELPTERWSFGLPPLEPLPLERDLGRGGDPWGGPTATQWTDTKVAGTESSLRMAYGATLVLVDGRSLTVHREPSGSGRTLELSHSAGRVELAPSRALIAFENAPGAVVVDTRDCQVLATIPTRFPAAVAVDAREPRRGYVACEQSLLYLDLATGRVLATASLELGLGGPVMSVHGRFLYDSRGHQTRAFDLERRLELPFQEGQLQVSLAPPRYRPAGVAGHLLAAQGAFRAGLAGKLEPWSGLDFLGELPAGQLLCTNWQELVVLDPCTLERRHVEPLDLPPETRACFVHGSARLLAIPRAAGAPVRYRDLTPPPPAGPLLEAPLETRASPLETWEQPLRFAGTKGPLEVVPITPGLEVAPGGTALRWTPTLNQVGPQLVSASVRSADGTSGRLDLPVNVSPREVRLPGATRLVRLPGERVVWWTEDSTRKPGRLGSLDLTSGEVVVAELPWVAGDSAQDGSRLWLGSGPELALFDLPALELRGRFTLDRSPERGSSAVHPDGELSWVRSKGGDLLVFRLEPEGKLRTVLIPRAGDPSRQFDLAWVDRSRFVLGSAPFSWADDGVQRLAPGAAIPPARPDPLEDAGVRVEVASEGRQALRATFTAAGRRQPLATVTWQVRVAAKLDGRALLLHGRRTLIVPAGDENDYDGRKDCFLLLRYDTTGWPGK